MTTITTYAVKGPPGLTNAEIDANFNNLNSAKLEASNLNSGTLPASVTALSLYSPTGGAVESPYQYFGSLSNTQAAAIAALTTSATGGYLRLKTAQNGTGVMTTRIEMTDAGVINIPGNIAVSGPINLGSFTVATLPAGTVGATAYVTDATAPTYLGALTGGGAVRCPVFKNATVWVSA